MTECSYSRYAEGRRCRNQATHTVKYGRKDHPLCEEHAKPQYHPPDLRSKVKKKSWDSNERDGAS